MKRKKFFLIILFLMFIMGLAGTIILGETFGGYHGKVEGTNFVLEEWVGAGSKRYDADDEGNLYFLVQGGMFEKQSYAVVIYGPTGQYKYTLYPEVSVGTAIRIRSGDNHILVYDSKAEELIEFDDKGFLVTKKAITENDIKNYDLTNFGSDYTETIRNRGEFVYKNDFGTIRGSINGKEIVVFTVPTWQVLYKIFDIIKYISLAGLFVFGFVIPVIRKTNGYK